MNVLEVNFEKKLKNFPLHIQFQDVSGFWELQAAEKV